MPRGRTRFSPSASCRPMLAVPKRWTWWWETVSMPADVSRLWWDALARAHHAEARQLWWFFTKLETAPIARIEPLLLHHKHTVPPQTYIAVLEHLVSAGLLSRREANDITEYLLTLVTPLGTWT